MTLFICSASFSGSTAGFMPVYRPFSSGLTVVSVLKMLIVIDLPASSRSASCSVTGKLPYPSMCRYLSAIAVLFSGLGGLVCWVPKVRLDHLDDRVVRRGDRHVAVVAVRRVRHPVGTVSKPQLELLEQADHDLTSCNGTI